MFYFILGALAVFTQITVRKQLVKTNSAKLWPNCLLVLASNLMIMFSIAWAYESFLEFETQAAMMGLIFFGLPGIIMGIITYRIVSVQTK